MRTKGFCDCERSCQTKDLQEMTTLANTEFNQPDVCRAQSISDRIFQNPFSSLKALRLEKSFV